MERGFFLATACDGVLGYAFFFGSGDGIGRPCLWENRIRQRGGVDAYAGINVGLRQGKGGRTDPNNALFP